MSLACLEPSAPPVRRPPFYPLTGTSFARPPPSAFSLSAHAAASRRSRNARPAPCRRGVRRCPRRGAVAACAAVASAAGSLSTGARFAANREAAAAAQASPGVRAVGAPFVKENKIELPTFTEAGRGAQASRVESPGSLLALLRAQQAMQERQAERTTHQQSAADAERRRQGDAADAAAADHGARVLCAAAVDCPGVAILVGRTRGGGGGDAPLLRRELGFADLEQRTPVTPDTIFRLSTLTKPIVAASMLPLLEKGLVSLNAPISTWLPDFDLTRLRVWHDGGLAPPRRPIRLLDVLRHTGGFFYPAGHPAHGAGGEGRGEGRGLAEPALCRAFAAAELGAAASPAAFCERLAQVPLCDHPGSRFEYSPGTAVLARVAEVVTGQTYERYLDEALLTPLAMSDTGFFFRDKGQQERLAKSYLRKPCERPFGPPRFEPIEERLTYEPGSGLDANCGLFGTLDDYGKFVRFLLSDGMGIVQQDMLYAFGRDQLGGLGVAFPESLIGFPASFGLGTYIHDGRLCGWSGMANGHFCFDVRRGRYSILLAQAAPFSWEYQRLLTLPARTRRARAPGRSDV